jgi:hypothetical protein
MNRRDAEAKAIRREANGVILSAKGRDVEEITKAVEFDTAECLDTNAVGQYDPTFVPR